MSVETIGPIAAALGLGAILSALAQRIMGRPAPSGADGRLADAQADKARAEAEALAWTAMRAELDRVTAQVHVLTDQVSAYRVTVDTLSAEVARLRTVEAADKRRIAELEGRVAELESGRRGATGGAGA